MLNIYKASAGSGKTHTLTKKYILLLFDKNRTFANILAVTFTNKAAGEMKERVIEELRILSENPQQSTYYNEIRTLLKLQENELKNLSLQKLKSILHNYTAFNISTIDSFVQKIIRAFTFELKIPTTYELEMDLNKVATELTNDLIENLKNNENLQKWLTSYAYEQIAQGKKWDFRENITNFAKNLFKENLYDILFKINQDSKTFTDNLTKTLTNCNTLINKYQEKIDYLYSKGKKIVNSSGILTVKAQKVKYLTKFFTNNDKNYNFSLNATLTTAINSEQWWNKTTAEKEKAKWNNTINQIVEILNEILDYEKQKGIDYFSAISVKKNIFNFGVLNNLFDLLPDYRTRNNVLIISDLTLILKQIIGTNDAPFIYEKIGNKYKNIMIDEFQDTSDFQWHNFKPLILNTLANNEYNLIVGDVKQSVYRWRNGDWQLLHSKIKTEIGQNFVKETPLNTNWRSKTNIIEFNNTIFSILPKIIQKKLNDTISDKTKYSKLIEDAYSDVIQEKSPENINNNTGYVELKFFDNTSWKKDVDEDLPKLIEKILENYSPGDIGILVRTNDEANNIMKILLEYLASDKTKTKFNVISAESLLLANSLSVKIIIKAIELLINPENIILAIEIIVAFNNLNNITANDNKIYTIKTIDQINNFLPNDFITLFENFTNYSLFSLIEKIISIFKLTDFDTEIPFLRTLQEIAFDYVNKIGDDIFEFINYWTQKSKDAAVQLSELKNAIQIMTIHKSKGLAFKVVIIPYINWKISPRTGTLLWANTNETPFNNFKQIPVEISKITNKTHFNKEHTEETIYSAMDTLNILYVALTRAKDQIYGNCKIAKKNGNSIADYIYSIITNNTTAEMQTPLLQYLDTQKTLFTMGNPLPTTIEKNKISETNFKINNYPINNWENNIAIVTHNEELIAETIETRKNAIKNGIIMHKIMETTNSISDSKKIIEKIIKTEEIKKKNAEEIIKIMTKVFDNEQIKEWFDPKWTVFAEKEILTTLGTTKIPDRVISNNKEIIIIDYKFGQPKATHKKQISTYCKIINKIENKKTSGYIYYAMQNKTVKIC